MNTIDQEGVKKRIEILKMKFNINTGSDFAKSVGINKSNFYQAMKGEERHIGESMINKIAACLHINREWLLTGNGEIYINMEEKRIEELYENHKKLVDAHIILVKNSETLTNANIQLVEQNKELFEENKKLREVNEKLMDDCKK